MWSPHFCRLKSGVFYCYKADDKSGYGEGAAELEVCGLTTWCNST